MALNPVAKQNCTGGDLASPTEIAGQCAIERGFSGNDLVIDGAIVALLANVPDELLHHLLIGRTDCARIGDDLQMRRFQILEQDIAFKGQVEFGLIEPPFTTAFGG